MKFLNKYFPIFYISLLFLGYFYVRDIIGREELKVGVIDDQKESIEIKPIDVTLMVKTRSSSVEYLANMKNINTLDDLLEDLRDEVDFFFEKTEYTYGTEYDLVNHTKAQEGYAWKVYEDDEDITQNTSGRVLKDKAVYILSLEKVK